MSTCDAYSLLGSRLGDVSRKTTVLKQYFHIGDDAMILRDCLGESRKNSQFFFTEKESLYVGWSYSKRLRG